jgi:hypothetical protein
MNRTSFTAFHEEQEMRTVITKMRILAAMAAMLFIALPAMTQQVAGSATGFQLTGFIEDATCTQPCSTLSGGTLTVNHIPITVPANTILQMPALALSWGELFSFAPGPQKASGVTGLAIKDGSLKLPGTFEVTVQGNIVNGTYISGLIFISQQSLNSTQGFITSLNPADGSMMVANGSDNIRVQINDPKIEAALNCGTVGNPACDIAVGTGRYSQGQSPDVRFTVDQANPTIRSETGYPMCIPRATTTTGTALTDDPRCPQKNRPKNANGFVYNFTMDPPGAAGGLGTDAFEQMPFEVGDFVNVIGVQEIDGNSTPYISAYQIIGNVGAYTAAGLDPAYVGIDVLLQGTGAIPNPAFPQETTAKVKVEGFTTDSSRTVDAFAMDIDCNTGAETERQPAWVSALAVDQGPPTGAVRGRFRFRPLGGTFIPPARDVRARITGSNAAQANSINGRVVANGLVFDSYTAPDFAFIFPENLAVGDPMPPSNFADFAFLAHGVGSWNGVAPTVNAGQLTPWPDVPGETPAQCGPKPALNANFTVNGQPNTSTTLAVQSGASITLDASAAAASGATKFTWSPIISCSNVACSVGTLTAPTVAVVTTQKITLSVNGGAATASATVTVNPPSPKKDVVTITGAVYRISKARLDVTATTNIVAPSVGCTLANTPTTPGCMEALTDITNPATGKPYAAVMQNLGNGSYTVTFTGLAAPNTITVVSGNGGLATTGITRLR